MPVSKIQATLLILALIVPGIPNSYADTGITLNAIDEVLFDYDKVGLEFINYKVTSTGHVSLTVDESVPDDLYVELIQLLRAHKDIRSVLAGRDNICSSTFIVR